MSVVLDDLPALMWHAELGRPLPDLWSGGRHRGAQLHDLRAAVTLWAARYGQRAWLRQLEPPAGRAMEDALLRTIARLDGTPFPSAPGSPPGGCAGGCRRPGGAVAAPPWKPPTAPRSWPSPTRPWACCPPGGRGTGMTLAGSGAGTTSACPREPGSAGRSPSRSPRRSSPQLMTDNPQAFVTLWSCRRPGDAVTPMQRNRPHLPHIARQFQHDVPVPPLDAASTRTSTSDPRASSRPVQAALHRGLASR